VALHPAKKAARFEALEPLRRGVRDCCGFRAGAAAGTRNRHDHGSRNLSDDYQAEIAFLPAQTSHSFVRAPECNGFVERSIRARKGQLPWVRYFKSSGNCGACLRNFASATTSAGSYSAGATSCWLRLASSSAHSKAPHEYTQFTAQKFLR